jgi:hypothetical protein
MRRNTESKLKKSRRPLDAVLRWHDSHIELHNIFELVSADLLINMLHLLSYIDVREKRVIFYPPLISLLIL